jgi:hypothetical protein
VGVGFLFHVLRCRTCFSVVTRASGLVFMFYAPEVIFGGSEGVRSLLHVLHSRTYFRPYRGCRVLFSCFTLPNSFSALPMVQGSILMFSAPGLIFIGTKGLDSRIYVFRSRTHFRRYRGRRVPFTCFAHPDSFSTVPRASGPVFMFIAPEHIFGGIVGVRSLFHVLHCRTHFMRYRGLRVSFSCFALPDSFSEVLRASGSVFMFCTPGLIFDGSEGVGYSFHVLCSRTHFRRYRGRRVPF